MPFPAAAQLSQVVNAAQAVLGLAEELRTEAGIDTELADRLHAEVTRLIRVTQLLGNTVRRDRAGLPPQD